MDRAGLYGSRVAAVVADPRELDVPPYIASLTVAEEAEAARLLADPAAMEKVGRLVHPYGGVLALAIPAEGQDWLRQRLAGLAAGALQLAREGPLAVAIRAAGPPGAADYTGRENGDAAVHMPLGVAWFGDTQHHHKLFYKAYTAASGFGMPTNIQVVDGLMKYTVTTAPYGPNPPGISYPQYMTLLKTQKTYVDSYTDIYTGRLLPADQAQASWPAALPASTATVAPPPSAGVRRNPLTGLDENREFQNTHGSISMPWIMAACSPCVRPRPPSTTSKWRAAQSTSAGSARVAATASCRPTGCCCCPRGPATARATIR